MNLNLTTQKPLQEVHDQGRPHKNRVAQAAQTRLPKEDQVARPAAPAEQGEAVGEAAAVEVEADQAQRSAGAVPNC